MSSLSIYKPGQGYWTRVCSAVGAGTMVLAGVAWLARQLEGPLGNNPNGPYLKAGICAVIVIAFAALLYHLLNKPRIVDFMIATESEMRKVNWPTRRETIGTTWIVICGTAMMAILLFGIDVVFAKFFQFIGVLTKS